MEVDFVAPLENLKGELYLQIPLSPLLIPACLGPSIIPTPILCDDNGEGNGPAAEIIRKPEPCEGLPWRLSCRQYLPVILEGPGGGR